MTERVDQTLILRSFRHKLLHAPDLDSDMVSTLQDDPDGLVESGEMLKDGDRSTVVKLSREGCDYLLKRYNLRGPLHTAAHLLLRSRARWSWDSSLLTRDCGLVAPRPLACMECRFGAFRGRSYFLSEFVPGRSLLELALDPDTDSTRLEDLARRFAEIWKILGQAHLSHGDMKATNFIVSPEGNLWMLDLDGMRQQRPGPWWRRERNKDRRRFMKNWSDRPESAKAFLACVGTD